MLQTVAYQDVNVALAVIGKSHITKYCDILNTRILRVLFPTKLVIVAEERKDHCSTDGGYSLSFFLAARFMVRWLFMVLQLLLIPWSMNSAGAIQRYH